MGAQERFRSGGDAVGRRRGGQAVAREACALVDDGDAPIKALVDLDERLGIAAPTARREQLDQFRPKGDGVVVADRALVFEAEDGLGIEACGPRTIGGSRIGRLLGEAGIEARKEVPQEGIRALAIDDAGEAQFGAQAILAGAKEPLDATLRLRALGGDPLDAEFLQSAGDLCGGGFPSELLLEGKWFGLTAVEDAVAITVHGDRDALRLRQGVQDLEVAMGILLVPEGGGEDLSSGVVHGHDDGEARTPVVEPGVGTAVELDEEAGLRHPLAPAAVARGAAPPRATEACGPQDALNRGT